MRLTLALTRAKAAAMTAALFAATLLLFVILLLETLVYVWKRGALDWNVARRGRNRRVVVDSLEDAA